MEDELKELGARHRGRGARASTPAGSEGSRTTTATFSSRCAPAPAAMRRRCSPAISFGCTPAMPSPSAGRSRSLSESPGEHGGYKEIISRIIGKGAYSPLKFESGTHRVQRVPCHRSSGPHPHIRRHGGHSSRARGGRIHRAEPGGLAHRHLPLLRRRRPARQQDRLRDPGHAPAHRDRGRMPGRALAAQESLARAVALEGPAPRERTREAGLCSGAIPQASGRLGRPVGAHPHRTIFRRAASPITASI